MDIQSIMDIWNTQMSKADGKNHTKNTVLLILSKAMNEWKQYKEIGTVEEFRQLKSRVKELEKNEVQSTEDRQENSEGT